MELEEGDASDPGEMFWSSFKEEPVLRSPVRKGEEKISKGKKDAGKEQESSAKSEAESSGRVRVD